MKHLQSLHSLFLILAFCFASEIRSQVVPLPNAHAHNDYKHKHPLSDAINYGFTSFEADIFLKHKQFIVAHISPLGKKKKTLEALYLKPLFDLVTKQNGWVYPNYNSPVILLIDIKTAEGATYDALMPLLQQYASILTSFENGVVTERAVTIIITGRKPYDPIQNARSRIAFIDGNLMQITKNNISNTVTPLASTKYSNVLSWKGKGEIPEAEKKRLIALVKVAHTQGKKVRLWASPENKVVWEELLNCGVDLINTDQLENLHDFLLKKEIH